RDALVATAELPGVEEKDIACTLADGVLAIKTRRRLRRERKRRTAVWPNAASYGSFYHAVPLAIPLDADRVRAVNRLSSMIVHKGAGNTVESRSKTASSSRHAPVLACFRDHPPLIQVNRERPRFCYG